MTVCNACRYCEAYCPVFQAMEERLTFSSGDIAYLANLCHNCGECLYACQYAPPHEFAIDVPRTFAGLRVESYEAACWPAFAAPAFRRPRMTVAMALLGAAAIISALAARTLWVDSAARTLGVDSAARTLGVDSAARTLGVDSAARTLGVDSAARTFQVRETTDFYSVIPHHVMVTVFGIAALFAVVALTMGYRRYAVLADLKGPRRNGEGPRRGGKGAAARDVFTLKHLHATGQDCTDAEDTRRPWRRWMHHCTFYGFLLCTASTTVAAIYHLVFGWLAPYAYMSVPVVIGTLGGLGLLIGPAGLFLVDRVRDPALMHPAETALDGPFLAMLFLTSLTGLLLLVLREGMQMPALLVVHLAFVLALFVTLPYGKFVHGIYRAAALVKFRAEESNHQDTKTE